MLFRLGSNLIIGNLKYIYIYSAFRSKSSFHKILSKWPKDSCARRCQVFKFDWYISCSDPINLRFCYVVIGHKGHGTPGSYLCWLKRSISPKQARMKNYNYTT